MEPALFRPEDTTESAGHAGRDSGFNGAGLIQTGRPMERRDRVLCHPQNSSENYRMLPQNSV